MSKRTLQMVKFAKYARFMWILSGISNKNSIKFILIVVLLFNPIHEIGGKYFKVHLVKGETSAIVVSAVINLVNKPINADKIIYVSGDNTNVNCGEAQS